MREIDRDRESEAERGRRMDVGSGAARGSRRSLHSPSLKLPHLSGESSTSLALFS